MIGIPTNGELAFWCILAFILIAGLIFSNQYAVTSTYIDDIDAWTRNYEKIQRRR